MSRHYPRFLFSNPKNTKSKGPFVVHTVFPKCIFSLEKDIIGKTSPCLFDIWESPAEYDTARANIDEVFKALKKWLANQQDLDW